MFGVSPHKICVLLPMVQRVFFNKLEKPENVEMKDLNGREIAIMAPLCALMIIIGWHPTPILERMEPSVREVEAGGDRRLKVGRLLRIGLGLLALFGCSTVSTSFDFDRSARFDRLLLLDISFKVISLKALGVDLVERLQMSVQIRRILLGSRL